MGSNPIGGLFRITSLFRIFLSFVLLLLLFFFFHLYSCFCSLFVFCFYCQYGRVVKALDLKSNGLCPRRFKSCCWRAIHGHIFFFEDCHVRSMHPQAQKKKHTKQGASSEIRTHASEENRTWVDRLRPLGHERFVLLLSVQCSKKQLVKPAVGFEPTTPCLRGRCNNHYATLATWSYMLWYYT